jgi:predicted SAM-dependent methyltransferase
MIEHLSYDSGRVMLSECFRVIKPGGRIRVATPDLNFLVQLYLKDDAVARQYIAWVGQQFLDGQAPHCAASVINNFVRAWGHTFIYDFDTLRASMEAAGFQEVTAQRVNISPDPHLTNLENKRVKPVPSALYELETFVLEGVRLKRPPKSPDRVYPMAKHQQNAGVCL